jgi:hypothetical protein
MRSAIACLVIVAGLGIDTSYARQQLAQATCWNAPRCRSDCDTNATSCRVYCGMHAPNCLKGCNGQRTSCVNWCDRNCNEQWFFSLKISARIRHMTQ